MGIYNDYKKCNNCGRINTLDNQYCMQCGENLEFVKIEIDTYTRNLELFIGKDSEYYIEKLNKMKEKDRTHSLNWPALLITPVWLLYRKMYGLGLGLIALNVILQNVTLYNNFLSIIIYVLAGLYGNTLYIKHIENKIKKSEELDESSKSKFITKNSGVSIAAPIVAIILLFIVEYIVVSLCM